MCYMDLPKPKPAGTRRRVPRAIHVDNDERHRPSAARPRRGHDDAVKASSAYGRYRAVGVWRVLAL